MAASLVQFISEVPAPARADDANGSAAAGCDDGEPGRIGREPQGSGSGRYAESRRPLLARAGGEVVGEDAYVVPGDPVIASRRRPNRAVQAGLAVNRAGACARKSSTTPRVFSAPNGIGHERGPTHLPPSSAGRSRPNGRAAESDGVLLPFPVHPLAIAARLP